MAKKKRKSVEDRIDELKTTVTEEYFKANPLKVFPDDFLNGHNVISKIHLYIKYEIRISKP